MTKKEGIPMSNLIDRFNEAVKIFNNPQNFGQSYNDLKPYLHPHIAMQRVDDPTFVLGRDTVLNYLNSGQYGIRPQFNPQTTNETPDPSDHDIAATITGTGAYVDDTSGQEPSPTLKVAYAFAFVRESVTGEWLILLATAKEATSDDDSY
jgi:hypothetical protein